MLAWRVHEFGPPSVGRSALPQPLPLTLRSDFSGEIVDVGQASMTGTWESRCTASRIRDVSV